MTAPLRIVHAVRSHRFAGVEQHIRRLAIAQAREGDEVVVIGGDPMRMAPSLHGAGVVFEPATTTLDVVRALRRHRAGTDVVNSHMTAADGAAVVALRGKTRPALVSTRHFAQPRARFRPLGRWIDARMDAEIAISRTVAARVDVPTTVVPSGVETVEADARPREAIVLIAQRLEAEKHTADGLRAFALADIADDGWRLFVAGEGAQRAALERLAADLGIAGTVTFGGFRDDLPDLMATSGILLAPCPFEHLGLTVLEAMAAGLPVVAADAGGHAELLETLDERTRYRPSDIDAAADRLRSLAADPEARAAISASERARQAAEFSITAQEAATRAVYERAIGERVS